MVLTGEKTITFSRPEEYPLGSSTYSQTFDYKNAPSGSLTLQLAIQSESVKIIHSLAHDIVSLQQNPIGFRNSILIEQEMPLFHNQNIYPHETIQPYNHETISLCSDAFSSSQHNSPFNDTIYTTANSQSLKTKGL